MEGTSSNYKKSHKKLPLKEKLKRFILITIGAILMAIALELFLVPNKLLDGGIVGISIISSHFLKLPIGLFIFILNIPFFILDINRLVKHLRFLLYTPLLYYQSEQYYYILYLHLQMKSFS